MKPNTPKTKKANSRKNQFPHDAIPRIARYLRILRYLRSKNFKVISSAHITNRLNVTSEQFRKDLSYFGEFGKRGVGYDVNYLIGTLENILGVNRDWPIALVGVGRLGAALLSYPGFAADNMRIAVAFDINPKRIGRNYNGVPVKHIDSLKEEVQRRDIKIAMLCVQAEASQEVADKMVEAGIKAILNFAPFSIKVRNNVLVSRVDMAAKLESLIFFVNQQKNNY